MKKDISYDLSLTYVPGYHCYEGRFYELVEGVRTRQLTNSGSFVPFPKFPEPGVDVTFSIPYDAAIWLARNKQFAAGITTIPPLNRVQRWIQFCIAKITGRFTPCL